MKQAGTTPQRFAGWFASKPDQVEENVELFDEFLDRVESFWRDVGHVAWIHLEDSRQLKAVFAGEPFPNTNPAAGAGLYVDTIVLPDPMHPPRAGTTTRRTRQARTHHPEICPIRARVSRYRHG